MEDLAIEGGERPSGALTSDVEWEWCSGKDGESPEDAVVGLLSAVLSGADSSAILMLVDSNEGSKGSTNTIEVLLEDGLDWNFDA